MSASLRSPARANRWKNFRTRCKPMWPPPHPRMQQSGLHGQQRGQRCGLWSCACRGRRYAFGSLARQIAATSTPTSFEKALIPFRGCCCGFMACMAPVVFFVNGFSKGDWVEAGLFAPFRCRGPHARNAAHRGFCQSGARSGYSWPAKVIARRLNAIQNLGAMDVLCTDKTGTLTQDRIVWIFARHPRHGRRPCAAPRLYEQLVSDWPQKSAGCGHCQPCRRAEHATPAQGIQPG